MHVAILHLCQWVMKEKIMVWFNTERRQNYKLYAKSLFSPKAGILANVWCQYFEKYLLTSVFWLLRETKVLNPIFRKNNRTLTSNNCEFRVPFYFPAETVGKLLDVGLWLSISVLINAWNNAPFWLLHFFVGWIL